MKKYKDISLKKYNTFAIECQAKELIEIESAQDLLELYRNEFFLNNKFLVLGGGSNILFSENYNGTIIVIDIRGIKPTVSKNNRILITASAGENWHEFVKFTINNDMFGLENLALIPGKVGAAPVQNIGAYGIEQKDFFYSLEAFNIETGNFFSLNHEECKFGYRNSVFKNELKGKAIVTEVTYSLLEKPNLNLSYKDLQESVSQTKELTTKDVFDSVCRLREKKLPDPEIIGSGGSFFKNPIVTDHFLNELKSLYPYIPSYKHGENEFKISAGWLIEQCGFKGIRRGQAGVYPKHALILVNYGEASGKELIELANDIIETVLNKFNIKLEPEVIIV